MRSSPDCSRSEGIRPTSPARLVMVWVLQSAEGLTDRRAAEAVRGRVDWEFLLGPVEGSGVRRLVSAYTAT
ncbi:transposase [Streptomyces mauvecolor]